MALIDETTFEPFTVAQLREELKLGILPSSGNKPELIKQLTQDNVEKIKKRSNGNSKGRK